MPASASAARTSRNPEKPGLRIDFNRYVAGQEFLGLKSLALDNLWQDPSMIRERLAMLVFRRMGLPAPRETHARVYIGGNREFAGVYGVVEVIDKRFLERAFGEDDGYLYEYQWQEPYGFGPPRDDLEWYAARFDPKTHETAGMFTLFGPIRDLVQAINDAPDTSLEEWVHPYLDVRRYITHIAIENFLSEPDGLLGGLGMNNFYLVSLRTDRQVRAASRGIRISRSNGWTRRPRGTTSTRTCSRRRSGRHPTFATCTCERWWKSRRWLALQMGPAR